MFSPLPGDRVDRNSVNLPDNGRLAEAVPGDILPVHDLRRISQAGVALKAGLIAAPIKLTPGHREATRRARSRQALACVPGRGDNALHDVAVPQDPGRIRRPQ